MIVTDYTPLIPPSLRHLPLRPYPLDEKLLLFDRDSGMNFLLEGAETTHLRQEAPRSLLIAVTNACNMSCTFCYRDLKSASKWRYDSLLEFCREADKWGVLEIAFGGGEPTLFPNWSDFLCELYDSSALCLNFTTNGLRINDRFLDAIRGKYGQIRLSLYDDNDYVTTINTLVQSGARFGVNWMITPHGIPEIRSRFTELYEAGVRDFLLLRPKGLDFKMHLNGHQLAIVEESLTSLYECFGHKASIKLDVCWGNCFKNIPVLFPSGDCGAADEFLSITSDRRVKVCSFQETSVGIPFDSLQDVRAYWESHRGLRQAANINGCARPDNSILPIVS